MDTDTRRLVAHKRKSSSRSHRRPAPPPLRATCLLDLPDEVLLEIFRLLSLPTWRMWSHTTGRVVNLRETCTRFNAVLDSLVTRLWLTNTSTTLTVAGVCGKIHRCSPTLTSLTLYRLYPATATAHDSLVAAVNACSRVRTLCLTPGTANASVAHQLASMTRITAFVMIPNSVFIASEPGPYTREQDGESIAILERLYSPQVVPEMVVWHGGPHYESRYSRDPALAFQPNSNSERAKLFWVDSLNNTQVVMSAGEYFPDALAAPGHMCPALRLGEFTSNERVSLDVLSAVDCTTSAGLHRHAVFLSRAVRPMSEWREPIFLSRIVNVVIPPSLFSRSTVQLIAPALGRSVTLWVPFMGVAYARKHAHPGVAVAPLWFVHSWNGHMHARFEVSTGLSMKPF